MNTIIIISTLIVLLSMPVADPTKIDAEMILPDHIPDAMYTTPFEPLGSSSHQPEMEILSEFDDDTVRFADIEETKYVDISYNITSFDTATDFLDRCPVYAGKGQCVSRSRYLSFEAAKHNISLGTCVVGDNGNAEHTTKHQVNTFNSDGIRYYTSNFNSSDNNLHTSTELLNTMNDKMSLNLTHLNARDFWHPVAGDY